jgi:predicted PurR-regulated permease PerM
LSRPVNLLARRMPRGGAIAVAYVVLILIPVLLALIIVPPIVNGAGDLADEAPRYARDARTYVEENRTLRRLEDDYGVLTKVEEEAAKLPSRAGDAAGALSDLGVGIVNSIFAAVTILILSVFMVAGGGGWIASALKLMDPARARPLQRALDRIGVAVGNYVAGAMIQAVIAGVLAYIVLLILGVPFAAPLAVLVGLFDLIPLVGATIAAAIVAVVTVFANFPTDLILWVIWAVVYQQLEKSVIQPQIQTRAVEINPFVVLVSVLFGSALFGVTGALLAVPMAASLQIVLQEWWSGRLGTAAPPPPAPDPG